MAKQRPEKKRKLQAAGDTKILPIELRIGDRLADERIAHGVPDGRALLACRHDVLAAQDGELLRHGGLVEI